MRPEKRIAIIGGGPAGLRSAEVVAIAAADAAVTLFDAKPSVGRKFLVAGKGGLNLTNAEPVDSFAARYSGPEQPSGFWSSLLGEFGAEDLRAWAAELGCVTFVASSGRVYPVALKAAPLLRSWVRRLRGLGVEFAMKHRWTGLRQGPVLSLDFIVGRDRPVHREFDAVILALGGASWSSTGSDGTWTSILQQNGVEMNPLTAANCGWEVDWPPEWLAEVEGNPLKNIVVSVGERKVAGELMVTRYGLEGGPLYELGPELRSMEKPEIQIDLKPTFTADRLVKKMESARHDFLKEARVRWKLSDTACTLLGRMCERIGSAQALASGVKTMSIPLTRPRPVEETISSAGGICWREIDSFLMLNKLPGVFVAGEMIDWEAPTGGFLIQGCFSSGTRAGRGAVEWLNRQPRRASA
jgi:uncharacterized flavoprotein (TIGR03862 family)